MIRADVRPMISAEEFQQIVIPRLNAEADPSDAELPQERRFAPETLPGFASIVHSTNSDKSS